MKVTVFSNFMLILLGALIAVFFHFKSHFNGADYFKKKTTILQAQVESEKLNHVLAKYEFNEFKQQVAEVLPQIKKSRFDQPETGFPLRNLASVVGSPNLEKLPVKNASSLFEEAKKLFRKNENAQASRMFEQLISEYPDSVHVIQAQFLMIESQFRLQEFDRVIESVDKMVTHYPENEMTGFALLRLGTVFEYEERPEDAIDVYKVVLKNFKNKDLRVQARSQLEAVHL